MYVLAWARYWLLTIQAILAVWIVKVRPYFWPTSWGPRHGTSFSSSWLQNVLRQEGLLGSGARVLSVTLDGSEPHRGLISSITRVKVTYEGAGTAGLPSSFILKMSQADKGGWFDFRRRRQVLSTMAFREAIFLVSPLAKAPSVQAVLARVYYGYSSPMLGEFVLLQEDLAQSPQAPWQRGLGANLAMGNQIWGLPADLPPLPDRFAVVKEQYSRAADMHADFWCDKRLLQAPYTDWLRSADWYNGGSLAARARWELALHEARTNWSLVRNKLSAANSELRFSPVISKIFEQSLARSSWEQVAARLQDPSLPFTLCHGDFHASNMMLLLNPPQASPFALRMFDWSEAGVWEPMTDLGQTLISDAPPAFFREHSKTLVRHYWTRLIERGVSAQSYPWERCWEDFCRAAVERWIWCICVMVPMPQVPAKLLQYLHDQLLAFIEAHGPAPEYYLLKPLVAVLY